MNAVSRANDDWMIAQLKPNGLVAARRNLARQGFDLLMPTLTVTRKQRDKLVICDEPAFPGYLFVRKAEGSAAADRISFTLGVTRLLLRADRSPATLSPGFVAALLVRCDAECRLKPAVLAPGDMVRVTQGPFADLVTRIVSLDSNGRLSIFIELLGRQVLVSQDRRHVDLAMQDT